MFQMESIGMVAVEQMFSSCAYEIGFVHSRKPFELELCWYLNNISKSSRLLACRIVVQARVQGYQGS
jgi:hypothetical protein